MSKKIKNEKNEQIQWIYRDFGGTKGWKAVGHVSGGWKDREKNSRTRWNRKINPCSIERKKQKKKATDIDIILCEKYLLCTKYQILY